MAAKKKTTKVVDDGIYYVVSRRKFFTVTPEFLFKTQDAAYENAQRLEFETGARYKVDRVELQG